MLEWFIELRETLAYGYQFIIKNIKDTDEEAYEVRSRKVLNTGASVHMDLEYTMLQHLDVFTNLEAL